jgi:hypothetical protein
MLVRIDQRGAPSSIGNFSTLCVWRTAELWGLKAT